MDALKSCVDNIECTPADSQYTYWRWVFAIIEWHRSVCESGVRQSKSQTVFPFPCWLHRRGKRQRLRHNLSVSMFVQFVSFACCIQSWSWVTFSKPNPTQPIIDTWCGILGYTENFIQQLVHVTDKFTVRS